MLTEIGEDDLQSNTIKEEDHKLNMEGKRAMKEMQQQSNWRDTNAEGESQQRESCNKFPINSADH